MDRTGQAMTKRKTGTGLTQLPDRLTEHEVDLAGIRCEVGLHKNIVAVAGTGGTEQLLEA